MIDSSYGAITLLLRDTSFSLKLYPEHNGHNLCMFLDPFNSSFFLGSSSEEDDKASQSKCVDTLTRHPRTQQLERKKTIKANEEA